MKQKVSVKVDIHEPEQITGAVATHDDVEEYSIGSDFHADILVEGVAFERKSVSDYVKSLKEDRLKDQTRRMGEVYEHAYILIDGDMSETDSPFKSDMNGTSIRGSWASMTAREDSGVHAVIPCSNPSMLADMAIRLARKHVEESDETFVPSPATEPDASTTTMMFACINGVGPKMAETLSDEFDSISDFMDRADYEMLQDIEGVGPKTATRILEAFI